ncbi:MAG: response regulator [Caldilineaceae bacterium]
MTSLNDPFRQIRLAEAETTLEALRRQEVDAVVGDNQVLLLRLQEVEQQLQKREEQLRELNRSLEARIAERTATLEQQTQRLRLLAGELTEAERRARKQLARTLHDGLQQILIGVEIQLEIYAMDGESGALSHAQKLLTEANQTCRTLAYELAPPALYEAKFTDALAWLVRWFGENHRFHITVEATDDLPLLAENAKVFLFGAVRELLLNSVKHSGVSKAVVRCATADAQWVQVEVSDDGNGFDPSVLDKMTDTQKGFGLLSIRERLIALGGTLEIVSAPGAGVRFLINFPRNTNQADAPKPEAENLGEEDVETTAAESEQHYLRILLVDDHRIVREGLVAMLQRRRDFQVVGEASNGIEAVKLAEQLHPDVILMDINMPHMNGIEATQRIKEKQPAINIIGLSWHEEADKAQAMYQAGATAYLCKDTATRTLLSTLQTLPLYSLPL